MSTSSATSATHFSFATAIARMEGFYVPNSRAARNCNPGNINWGAFAQAHGARRCEPDTATYKGRFAVFPDAQTGFAALTALFKTAAYTNLTVQQALLKYAPPGDHNDTANYIRNFCTWVGCNPTTRMDSLV